MRALVEANIEQRFAGIIGEPRVNVLRLNMELDEFARGGGLRKAVDV